MKTNLITSELVEALRFEYATLPEAKRIAAEHPEDALQVWSDIRDDAAQSASMKFRFAICECCEGHGKVSHPAFSNGITSSEWGEWDEEDRRSYMNGDYDVKCDFCNGSGKVKEPNIRQMNYAEKREIVRQQQDRRIMAELAQESAAERAMGA